MIFDTIKRKINSTNSNVSAAAILAISEFPTEETFEILFDKIGEENDLIRKTQFQEFADTEKILQNKIIESLKSSNWVTRNSALSCITKPCRKRHDRIREFHNSLMRNLQRFKHNSPSQCNSDIS